MNRPALLSLLSLIVLFVPALAKEQPTLVLQNNVTNGLRIHSIDLKNPAVVFAAVFAQLPDEVLVLPTENYCYWQLYCDGREIRGNLRLASGLREKGILSLGYAEFDEFPGDGGPEPEVSEAKYFDKADGVEVTCPDPFTAKVSYRGKSVTFRLHRLEQSPPRKYQLPPDERFLERTYDESGFQFHLLYNKEKKYFLWVLDEEVRAPDHFETVADDFLLGRRSGFVFWIDRANGARKVLAAVRQASVARNDWFDGPFDQLADNYAEQTNIRHYIEEACPECRGRIDKWGYFTDEGDRPNRVALNSYGTWSTVTDVVAFVERGQKSGDLRRYIAGVGREPLEAQSERATGRSEAVSGAGLPVNEDKRVRK